MATAAGRVDLEIVKGDSFLQTFDRHAETVVNFRSTYSELINYKADDLVIYRNASYFCKLTPTNNQLPTDTTYWRDLLPHDYSTSTFESKLRTDYSEEASVVDFTVGFVNDGTDGKIQISLTAAQTAVLDFDTGVYDVEVTSGTSVQKHVLGRVTLVDEATK